MQDSVIGLRLVMWERLTGDVGGEEGKLPMSIRRTLLIASTGVAAALACQGAAQAQTSPAQVEELIVTGIRASQAASIDTKRNADAVVDAITAEDVGKFPDKNLAEALQRVPGIVINREFGEGERVSLRGTAPNLTRTLLNGHALATADWFILEQLTATRSFNFLMIPSEVIGQVKVFKSPTADLEEGGIGGTIDVATRNPLDLKSMHFAATLQAAYTENSEKTDPQGSALFSWKNDAETFGVLVAGVYQKRRLRRDAVEVLGYFDADPGPGVTDAPSLIGSPLFTQTRIRKGGNFAVQYRPTDNLEFNLTGLYSKFGANNFNQNYLAWGSNALGGGGTLTNVTKVGDTAVAGRITSTAAGRGAVYDAIDRIANAKTRNLDLDVKFQPAEGWDLHLKVGYTDADGNTESQPFVEFGAPAAFDYDLRGSAPKVTFLNLDPTKPAAMLFDFASLHQVTNDDSEAYAYFDVEKRVEWGPLTAIKFGLKATDHERETDFQATTYGSFFLPLEASGCGGQCTPGSFAGALSPSDFLSDIGGAGVLRSFWQVDKKKLESLLFGLPASVRARVPLYSEIFSVEEKTLGGYAMGKFEGEGWRGNVGVRVVRTKQESKGYAVDLAVGTSPANEVSNAFGAFERVSADRTYTDILPSANFSFDLSDDIVVRFAAARTVARPDFTDVAPRVSLNPGALSGSGGNPDIDPYRANQFDLSLEWYPTKESVVAAALFYKDIQSFITDRPTTEVFAIETSTPNLTRCTPAGGANPKLYNCQFDINRRANGGGGRIQGLELTLQMPLKYGFGVQTNYTYSDAKANSGEPIPGNSKHTFNLVGYFENDRMSARLAYTNRSKFFITFDRASPLNQASLESLDASFSYNVTENVALTVDAVNLTDENIVQYSGDKSRPRGIYDNGRQYYAGVRVRF
jgi:iron complex outermembrane receptor protein